MSVVSAMNAFWRISMGPQCDILAYRLLFRR